MTLSSVNHDNNYTTTFSAQNIYSTLTTDQVATFSDGTIRNLIVPSQPQDAVSKAYVIASSNPGGPADSVQFNNSGFDGSANLLYDNTTTTLTINGDISLTPITISEGAITGLSDPVSDQQIATKNYVDAYSYIMTPTYIQSNSNVTYTGSQMINGIIQRNIFTSLSLLGYTVTDTTASAQQLFDATIGAVVGSTYKWKIVNDDPDSFISVERRDRFKIFVNPGTGVTFNPSSTIMIPRTYTLDAYIIFTSISPPAVTINVNSNFYDPLALFWIPNNQVVSGTFGFVNSISMYVSDNFLFNVDEIEETGIDYTYTTTDVKNGFIVRTPGGASNDTFNLNIGIPSQLFTIQNNGIGDINITGLSTIYTLTPSPIVVLAGYQTTIAIETTVTRQASTPGSNYAQTNYATSGGTGTGLRVDISQLETLFTISNAGTGYTAETTVTTTGGSSSGLRLRIGTVNGLGAITAIGDIVGPLSGYLANDVLNLVGGGNNAQIQLTAINTVNTMVISDIGDGAYSINDVLTILNGTTNNAQLTLTTKIFDVLSVGTIIL